MNRNEALQLMEIDEPGYDEYRMNVHKIYNDFKKDVDNLYLVMIEEEYENDILGKLCKDMDEAEKVRDEYLKDKRYTMSDSFSIYVTENNGYFQFCNRKERNE